MRLLYNLVTIELNSSEILLVNTLTGIMDVLDCKSYNILKKWENREKITPVGETEIELYSDLLRRGYLVDTYEDECKQKEELIAKLKNRYISECGKFKTLAFVLTYDCNFRCPYCYEQDVDKVSSVISKEMVDKTSALVSSETSEVLLFGGEPLLPGNREIIQYILEKFKDKKFSVITNGYMLLDYIPLFKKVKMSYIQVTIDGNRDTHDKRRCTSNGEGTYNRIMDGVDECLKNQIPVKVRMNVDNSNFEECNLLQKELEKKYEKYGDFFYTELYPIFQLKNNLKNKMYSEIYMNNYESKDRQLKKNRLIAKNRPIIDSFLKGTPLHPVYTYCYEHGKTIFVDAFGDIYSCILSVGNKKLSVGSYYPDLVFKENSIFTRTIEKIKSCKECKYTFICGGGCPLQLKDYTDLMQPVCNRTIEDINRQIADIYNMKHGEI